MTLMTKSLSRLWPFTRKPTPNPAQQLAQMGVAKRRQKIMETTKQMQRDLAAKGISVPERSRIP